MLSWSFPDADPESAKRLGQALGLRPLTAQLLINRGVASEEQARKFLAPRLANLRQPSTMAGFERTTERLSRAIAEGEVVGLFGDYDVDGITTCALLATFLRAAGGRVVPRVARRDSGYGLTTAEVERFAEEGCRLLITCDCGTSDHQAVARARDLRLDVLIVDHHQVPDGESGAYALINPHQPGCQFPFKGLASVGIAFYLTAALRTRLERERGGEDPALDPRSLLDLVALGTVADLAPLVEENRILVTAGLKTLSKAARPGLRALGQLANLDPSGPLTTSDIGFRLAPRLNAPGRLGDAQVVLELLLAGPEDAPRLATLCDEANRSRQQIQEKVLVEAVAAVESRPLGHSIVVAGEGWHPGVVGIVAAKLVDRFHRPSVVIALAGDEGRGSARSAGGLHLYQAFTRCAHLLHRHGGHAAAAGLSIDRERIAEFSSLFESIVAETAGDDARRGQLRLDARVGLEEIDDRLASELALLGPFGMGNPEPLLGARGLLLDRARVVGERHLQVTLRENGQWLDGIGFNLAPADVEIGTRVAAAFVPEVETWHGTRRVRLRLRELATDRDVEAR